MVLIAPSLLSADFSKLREEINAIESAGADWLHLDIMDGHFVPNLTFGPPIIKNLRPHTQLTFDTHLMIEAPEKWVQAYIEAGSNRVTVHQEACKTLKDTLLHIRSLGAMAGVSVKPSTPASVLEPVLDLLDTILVMTVEPGFSGQSFMHDAAQKISTFKQLLQKAGNQDCLIEVDGGMNAESAQVCVALGADVLVAGNAVFKSQDYSKAIQALR